MRKKILLISFKLMCFLGFSQIWEDQLREKNPTPNINEKYTAFENYKKTHLYVKGNGFNPYSRQMYFSFERNFGDAKFKPDALFKEWEKQKNNTPYSKNTLNSNWIAKGPINTPIILSNGKKRGNGRVNCIAFDPNDADIIWVGSPSGGLWRSEDGGVTWSTNTDNLPVIGISSIAIDPSNTQNMLIVTGDAYASDTYSIGVLKSTDGGNTWNTTSLSYNIDEEKTINKIIINPSNPDSVYCVTNSNIMISKDGGLNWSIIGPIGRWRDIEFKPGNPSVVYAAKQSSGGSNVYRSDDGGMSWNIINNGVASSGKYRPLIAVTPDNPEVIYALYSAADYSFHGLYKSIDSGNNWSLQSNSPNILGREVDGSGVGGQSWYDLSLGVSTNNESLVYVGGINLWKSTNNGVTWEIEASSGNNQQLYSYMHVDQHAFEFNPLNNIAYAGNDGGIYKYMNSLNDWVDISNGLEISQFYRLGRSRSNTNKLVAGAQDNGTEMLTNSTWDAIRGADGMECAIDPYDEDIIYSTSQYGGLRKSYNGGNNWQNIEPVSYDGAWVTPWKIHPIYNDLIVAGYNEVYKSNDGGATWDSISYGVSNGQSIRTIALAPSDPNYIYVGTYSLLKVTKDGGASWTNIKPGLPNYSITDVVVSNSNPEKIWVTLSGYNIDHKVYESNDGGTNWLNITLNGLPNVPANCIIHQKNTNDDLYVGTDLGVYYKNNSLNEWNPYMTGLPHVIIKELEIHYLSQTISAATYGRGVWESPVNSISNNIYETNTNELEILSNPAEEKITLNATAPLTEGLIVSIYTITGQPVLRSVVTESNVEISTQNISKGCYIVEVSGKDKFALRKKLIIK